MRFCHILHWSAMKDQASLCICAVSPEPSLDTYTGHENKLGLDQQELCITLMPWTLAAYITGGLT